MNAVDMDGLYFSSQSSFLHLEESDDTHPEVGILQREHPPQKSDYME